MSSALGKLMFKSCFSLEVPVSLHILDYSFVLLSDLGGAVVKNLPASARDARDMGSIPGSGRSPGVGNGNPLQYSCLENFIDRGAWWVQSMGFKESDTTKHIYTLQSQCPNRSVKMATRSIVLAWRIPGTAEPGGLPSLGSHRVGHD